jgi:hypothetical protein
MLDQITLASFPSFTNGVKARWAPVFLTPVAGSPERLIIGVAVVSSDGCHLELANALDRLRCLYGDNASAAFIAVQVTACELADDLQKRGIAAISEPRLAASSLSMGESREAEGSTLAAIAQGWLKALSSLHREQMNAAANVVNMDNALAAQGSRLDRLPTLVLDYVVQRKAGMANYFHRDLRSGAQRRTRSTASGIVVDFSGPRVVANFGTLKASAIAKSVDTIKHRLWDLKVDRDRDSANHFRFHEMLIQVPSFDDPQLTQRQVNQTKEALQDLEEQADQEELRLRPLHTVAEIGARSRG